MSRKKIALPQVVCWGVFICFHKDGPIQEMNLQDLARLGHLNPSGLGVDTELWVFNREWRLPHGL